ncbi:hypothetical protein MMC29_001159 [Sticta canariensis]|nr:hypothetical protein [Sticta canariensis]
MSLMENRQAQNNLLASSSKNADPANPNDQRRPALSPRLQSALDLDRFSQSSTTSSELNHKTGKSSTCFSSNSQTHPPATSDYNSEQSPTRLPCDAITPTQTARLPSTRVPYSEFERDYGDSDLDSLPAGFPYTSCYGAWCFACEYVRSMQALVTERMEGNGKYGPVRRTT